MSGSAAALRGGPELQVRGKMLTIVSYTGSRNFIVHFVWKETFYCRLYFRSGSVPILELLFGTEVLF